ncbi:Prokaryotic dksA/traR C4-type zinc finger family protein [uncultured delta proteobacterium]|uniref:Prokaryotic dksA/traR C4-type zinc finger family protein n=1 Tax=uncultured delta proteobacterium TaxID=34034 RepID=A0A212JQ30_9DELT|nr:Prokaryotic dksA/traR C4-type zinc finger family protein [uncultured delta proteobacterium]
MTDEDKKRLQAIIIAETARLRQDVEGLKEVTKPVAPEDMDDITRMDAIVNKSVNDAALAAAKSRLAKLEYAGKRLDDPEFGYCAECGEAIPFQRLLAMPESTLCVDCAE